jgi:hypothetical protein
MSQENVEIVPAGFEVFAPTRGGYFEPDVVAVALRDKR